MSETITINWSDEDNCYVATAPSMPGCIGTGDTVEEAKEDFEAAKLEWTDEAAERLETSRSTASIWAAAKAVAKELWHTEEPDRPFTDDAWERELQLLDRYRDEPDFVRHATYASKCFRIAAAVLKTAQTDNQ